MFLPYDPCPRRRTLGGAKRSLPAEGFSPTAKPYFIPRLKTVPMTIHRFYISPEQITSSRVRIEGDDAVQIRRVLRLHPGALLQVFDGSGREVEARITEIGGSEVIAEPLNTTHPLTETPCPVHLLPALIKGEKTDWVVEKATELGAASVVLFPARRSFTPGRECPCTTCGTATWCGSSRCGLMTAGTRAVSSC